MATTETDRLARAVRQWGQRALRQWVAGSVAEETVLRLYLHASELARELGLGEDRAAAIQAAFGEPEPRTIDDVVKSMAGATGA